MNTLYGIKNCDTVKKARSWLDANNIPYKFHDFRVDDISEAQVKSWIKELGLETLVNKRSTTWKELDESIKAGFNEATALNTILPSPTLIKRPLLDTGASKHLGFKESDYAKLFKL